jgi:hypothetical protein
MALIDLKDVPGIHVEHLAHQLKRPTTQSTLLGRARRRAMNAFGDLFRPEKFHAHLPVFFILLGDHADI